MAFGWLVVRMASVWCEPYWLMWAMASSSESTTFTAITGARYSSYQSCSVASTTLAPSTLPSTDLARRSQRISTPLAANTVPILGRKDSACFTCTSSDSVALQGLYFWVLALSVTFTARSRSTSLST